MNYAKLAQDWIHDPKLGYSKHEHPLIDMMEGVATGKLLVVPADSVSGMTDQQLNEAIGQLYGEMKRRAMTQAAQEDV